jgi:hypothetical protein
MEDGAYVQLPTLTATPTGHNITLVVSTLKEQGILLYHGFDEHMAIEVFRGRIRVSYDIGNYPVSNMFSFEQIRLIKHSILH